jgi:hypothetical protein
LSQCHFVGDFLPQKKDYLKPQSEILYLWNKPCYTWDHLCWPCLGRQGLCVDNHYRVLVWTLCLMHRCVCIWQYILQNYNYKLHFQNLSIYHISHVFIGTMAAENLDVCTACDPWDSNIQLTMVKDWRRQIYPKCHSNRKLMTILISKSWGCPPWGQACLS